MKWWTEARLLGTKVPSSKSYYNLSENKKCHLSKGDIPWSFLCHIRNKSLSYYGMTGFWIVGPKKLLQVLFLYKKIKFSFGAHCYLTSSLFKINTNECSEGNKIYSLKLEFNLRSDWDKRKAASQELNLRRKCSKPHINLKWKSDILRRNRQTRC